MTGVTSYTDITGFANVGNSTNLTNDTDFAYVENCTNLTNITKCGNVGNYPSFLNCTTSVSSASVSSMLCPLSIRKAVQNSCGPARSAIPSSS